MDVRALNQWELESDRFRHLLWLAVEVDDLSLGRILDEQLPKLSVSGVATNGEVIAFTAYNDSVRPLVIEFIATDEGHRGSGIGRRLILELQRVHPDAEIVAQTDDDAIGFYRSLGFAATRAPATPVGPSDSDTTALIRRPSDALGP